MPEHKLLHLWVPTSQAPGFFDEACGSLMRAIEIDLISCRAAQRGSQNRK